MGFLDIFQPEDGEDKKRLAAPPSCPPEIIEKSKQEKIQEFVRGEYAEKFTTHAFLKRNERLIFAVDGITLAEERKRKFKGAYVGVSFRVARGVYLRPGVFSAGSEAKLTAIDQGAFTLTNKRIVFTGERQSRDFPLSAINALIPGEDGIAINRKGKQRTECYLGTDRIKFILTLIPDPYDEWEQNTVEWLMDGEHLRKIIKVLLEE